jgi:hypothetical protein
MKINEVITEACWDNYKQYGMKKKGNKMVPDCRGPVKEGGWDTTATQGTVITPNIVRAALAVTQQFVNDFNRFLADRNREPVRMGKPTGSTAYHEIDPDDKIYGDIDLQMVAPPEPGITYGQFTVMYNKFADEFVRINRPAYVHPTESKPGHPIIKVGNDAYVQVDFMWHPENMERITLKVC